MKKPKIIQKIQDEWNEIPEKDKGFIEGYAVAAIAATGATLIGLKISNVKLEEELAIAFCNVSRAARDKVLTEIEEYSAKGVPFIIKEAKTKELVKFTSEVIAK